MRFTVVDFVFIGIIVLFALRCATRGLVGEAASLGALAAGVLAGIFFFRAAGALVRERLMPEVAVAPEIIAFIGLFLIAFLIMKLLGAVLGEVIRGLSLQWLDRLLGALLGVAEGIIIASALLALLAVQPLFDPGAALWDSFFANLILPLIFGSGFFNIDELPPGTVALAAAAWEGPCRLRRGRCGGGAPAWGVAEDPRSGAAARGACPPPKGERSV
ncbi:MAG: CvpA family protein [Treponema sp.]|nr:CvpA family protein [Treponema sp.]